MGSTGHWWRPEPALRLGSSVTGAPNPLCSDQVPVVFYRRSWDASASRTSTGQARSGPRGRIYHRLRLQPGQPAPVHALQPQKGPTRDTALGLGHAQHRTVHSLRDEG